MRGYFKINLTAEDKYLPKSSSKRTGEQRLALVERALRKDGVEFVEDFDGDCVIVRYGDLVDDLTWEAFQLLSQLAEVETEEVPA